MKKEKLRPRGPFYIQETRNRRACPRPSQTNEDQPQKDQEVVPRPGPGSWRNRIIGRITEFLIAEVVGPQITKKVINELKQPDHMTKGRVRLLSVPVRKKRSGEEKTKAGTIPHELKVGRSHPKTPEDAYAIESRPACKTERGEGRMKERWEWEEERTLPSKTIPVVLSTR
ncbi:hypothetical protein H4Q26_009567 [Puccinia striiformis f. sp. tritici PST-130]|nr:hypothetical protein H4Q26_009567 [Puccinia striiformis f. sp. tritici PST-130]